MWGWGKCVKYLQRGWNRREQGEKKNFKKGGKLGQEVGAIKKMGRGGLEPPYKLWQKPQHLPTGKANFERWKLSTNNTLVLM